MEATPKPWGRFLRYDYLRLDFTSVETPGMYVVSYGDARSNPFQTTTTYITKAAWSSTQAHLENQKSRQNPHYQYHSSQQHHHSNQVTS